jgi:hypothetical protein
MYSTNSKVHVILSRLTANQRHAHIAQKEKSAQELSYFNRMLVSLAYWNTFGHKPLGSRKP